MCCGVEVASNEPAGPTNAALVIYFLTKYIFIFSPKELQIVIRP